LGVPARRIDERFLSGLDRRPWGKAGTPLDGTRPSSAPLATRGVRAMDVEKSIPISPVQFAPPETLRIRPLLLKPQWMNGLSERMLVSHYENNYGGALRRLDAIRSRVRLRKKRHGFRLRN